MKKTKKEYHPPKIKPIIQMAARLIKNDPSLLDDIDDDDLSYRLRRLLSELAVQIPSLLNKSQCANCEAGMVEYIFVLDVIDGILLRKMSDAVKARLRNGMGLTEANRVRIPELQTTLAVRCRTTQCSKLGLIAKYKIGKKHVSGTWVLTGPGFAALRDEPVQDWVRVFRGKILERSENTVRLSQVFSEYRKRVQDMEGRGKKIKDDYRDDISRFDPSEWVHPAGIHQGHLL